MTRRETRSLLAKWGRIGEEIKAQEDQYKAICDEIDAVTDVRPQQLSGMPHIEGVKHPAEDAALRLIGLKERYADRLAEIGRKIEELERFRDRMEGAILMVNPNEEAVLRLKYEKGLTYEQVAEELNYSDVHVKRLELAAVGIITDFLEGGQHD